MIEDDADGVLDRRLVELLAFLAECGDGTVLGEPSRSRSGILRVSRTQADEFRRRLDDAYRRRFQMLVRFAAHKMSDASRAEDVVNRAFEKVLRRNAGDAPEIEELDAYVTTAVAHEINRELYSIVVQRERDAGEDLASRTIAVPAPGDLASGVAEAMQVRHELAQLPTRERQAVVFRLQWQFNVQETADIMGISTGTVKRYTSDGLNRLRARLAADGGAG